MARYLIGIVLFAGAFGSLSFGIRALRAAFLPNWRGSVAWLVDATLLIASILVVTQILGLLGLFRLSAVAIAYAGLGLLLRSAARRVRKPTATDLASAPVSVLGRSGRIASVVAVAGALGPWIVRVSVGFTSGVPGADTLWYHLPGAAKLTQTGSLRSIEFFDGGALTAYYPNVGTFFHATGMLFFESDIASPLVNFSWACLALLAGWCIGRPLGLSPATLIAVAVSISFPGYVGHVGGSAMSDMPAYALILIALALLINARPDRLTTALPLVALAAVATGAALGTKWTAIPAAGAVTVAILVMAPVRHRIRVAATWLAASAAAGLFTYVRNFIIVGNPLPPKQLSFGPITLDSVGAESSDQTVASWLFKDDVWNDVFAPGLEVFFGWLWVLALVVPAAALILSLWFSADRLYRLAAFTGVVSIMGYLFLPQNLVFFGAPVYFLSNIRYGIAAVGLGLLLLPTLPFLRRRPLIPVGILFVLLASSLLSPGTWTGIDDWRYQENVQPENTAAGLIAAVILLVGGLAIVERAPGQRLFKPLAAGVVVVAIVAAVASFPAYNDARYADEPHWNPAVDLTDARIAVDGVNAQFQFYGDDLSNYVQWVGEVSDGEFHRATSCEEWASLVREGEYTHVVALADTPAIPGPYTWTKNDPAAAILQDVNGVLSLFGENEPGVEAVAVFELRAPLDPARCTP